MSNGESGDNERFGLRLQRLRELRNLTQVELGRRAGMAAASVSHFETGQRMPWNHWSSSRMPLKSRPMFYWGEQVLPQVSARRSIRYFCAHRERAPKPWIPSNA
jgi:DNA-binding XRE family transcriptional regulator